MERVVFLDRSAIQAELRRPRFKHEWIEYSTTAAEDVVERLQEATIAITDRVFIGEAQLVRLPRLKFIAVAASGIDGIDLKACRRRGIAVSNVRGWSVSVPEHVFALILALRRNLLAYHAAVQDGAWQRRRITSCSWNLCRCRCPAVPWASSVLGHWAGPLPG